MALVKAKSGGHTIQSMSQYELTFRAHKVYSMRSTTEIVHIQIQDSGSVIKEGRRTRTVWNHQESSLHGEWLFIAPTLLLQVLRLHCACHSMSWITHLLRMGPTDLRRRR